MAQEYKQKDLGYPRKSTDSRLVVEMEDGSKWSVPVQIIVDDRDSHYKEESEDTIGFIREGSLDDFEIRDWAANNMNWDDVKEYAHKYPASERDIDYQDGWVNGEKKIEGEI